MAVIRAIRLRRCHAGRAARAGSHFVLLILFYDYANRALVSAAWRLFAVAVAAGAGLRRSLPFPSLHLRCGAPRLGLDAISS